MPRFYNRLDNNPLRRDLRRTMTQAEIALWSRLKGRGFLGYKFRRQYGVGRFVVDFYCPKLRLAVELDGGHHFEEAQSSYDQERDAWIRGLGIFIIRYPYNEVLKDIDAVLEDMARRIGRREITEDHPVPHTKR